jgi:hypothetical protein
MTSKTFSSNIYIIYLYFIIVYFVQALVTKLMHNVDSMFLFSNLQGWNSDNACEKTMF